MSVGDGMRNEASRDMENRSSRESGPRGQQQGGTIFHSSNPIAHESQGIFLGGGRGKRAGGELWEAELR